jgi:hypothetical protein
MVVLSGGSVSTPLGCPAGSSVCRAGDLLGKLGWLGAQGSPSVTASFVDTGITLYGPFRCARSPPLHMGPWPPLEDGTDREARSRRSWAVL